MDFLNAHFQNAQFRPGGVTQLILGQVHIARLFVVQDGIPFKLKNNRPL
jgi:hypothetical protein